MLHVQRNLYEALPDDEEREALKIAPEVEAMAAKGWLGNKSGVGFYKETKGASGREFWPLNLQTMEHEAPKKAALRPRRQGAQDRRPSGAPALPDR